MVVQFFKGGRTKQGAKSAINYLLNERVENGTAKVYEGNPELTLKIISQISRKWKFTSGVISFEEDYQKVSSLLPDIVKKFEETFFAGLSKDQYNILYVLHTDKGRTELHFLIPRIELTTGKDLAIYTHKKDLKKKDLFQQYINLEYGLSNPLDKERQETLKIEDRKWSNENKEFKKQLHEIIEQGVASGILGNREEIIKFLEDSGFTIKRKGKNYISVVNPNTNKSVRLKGEFYNEDWTIDRTIENQLKERERPDIAELKKRLDERVARDAEQNRKKYSQSKSKDIKRDRRRVGKVENTKELVLGNNRIDNRNNIDNGNMQNKNNDRRLEDDSVRTEIVRAVRTRAKVKQSIVSDFKKFIPRAEQIDNSTNGNDRKADRENRDIEQTNRDIDFKLAYINRQLKLIDKRIKRLKEAIMKKMLDNKQELELFKTQINIAQVAEDMGYEIDKKKSTRKSIVLKAGNDVIIVSRNADNNHYIYFNAKDPSDAGTIIDFVQKRTNKNLGQVRRLLRQYLQSGNRMQHLQVSSKEYIKNYYKTLDYFGQKWEQIKKATKEHNLLRYKDARGLSPITLMSTEYMGYDEEAGKIVFPVFNEAGICGLYLLDDNMKEKQFAKNSIKGIWADKKFHKNIDKIVITESPIDSLSLKEMGLDDENTLHLATIGRMGQEAKDTLKKIFRYAKNAELLIATDNDKAGQEIADEIVNIAKSVDFKGNMERMTFGKYKDANEYLMAIREQERGQSQSIQMSM